MLVRRLTTLPPLNLPKWLQPFSTNITVSPIADTPPTPPSPTPPFPMQYDIIAHEYNNKLKKLRNPNSNFLKYTSPHPATIDHTPILSSPLTRVTTLPNGLRVATESNLAAKTATVGVYIDAGSRFEDDEVSGVANMLGRVAFKGREDVENFGGCLMGCTSREKTSVYVKVLDKHVGEALRVLSDVVQNGKFSKEGVEREREAILREMEEGKGLPEDVIFDHLHATAFQHTPLGRSTIGPAESVKTINDGDIKNFMTKHFTSPRTVIAASGAVKHEDVVDQAKKLFTNLSSDATTTTELVAKAPAAFTGSEVRMIDDDIPLARFAVAFEGASWTDPDSIALMVMQSMLGSWDKSFGGGDNMGSHLIERVSINKLAESIRAFSINYKDTGLFGVYAVAKPGDLDDLAYAIMYTLSRMMYRVNDEDVIRASNQLKTSLLCGIDGTTHIADDIGRQLLTYGRRIPYAELFARIDAVDASTVKRVANRFIFDKDMALAGSGPIQGLRDYNWFRRRTFMVRY